MADSTITLPSYFDPKLLAKIARLDLRARMVVEGFFSGMHRSPHRGVSVEFAAHRSYTQGDDLRHIDWRVFGRTDKYYIKEYEQETNLEMMLMVDCSESMSFRSQPDGMSKYEYAATMTAAVSYLALQQQDSVGLILFDESITSFIRASNRSRQWQIVTQALSKGTGPTKTSLERVLSEVADRLSRRTLIILISDLFDDEEQFLRGMKLLRHHRHEPVVWNLWDRAELEFSYTGPTKFAGLEDFGTLLTDPRSLRSRYLEEVAAFQGRLRARLARMNVEYTVFDTAAPLDVALSQYLATRSARLRQRSSRVFGRR